MMKISRKWFWCTVLIMLLINPAFGGKKSAGKAMLLCLLPAGGQFYTERYVPGVIIGAGEITLGYFAYKNHIEKNYGERNSFLWWELFLFGYSLADAYVGAKMYGFDVETDINKVSFVYRIKF
uniref:DUF5683 domain-containing protein n=1 Tax=candidate division WOR-3 bacterium TaxID=2052148 RepID=A0A7C6EJV5_UNCW3